MAYSQEIHNLPCDDSAIAPELKAAFREGHKQARHAAAEIAAWADNRIAAYEEHMSGRETLRDKFAVHLAAAWLANPTTNAGLPENASVADLAAVVALAGYVLSDAMLAARKESRNAS